MKRPRIVLSLALAPFVVACNRTGATPANRASGYVEATQVRVSAEVTGRILELKIAEGDRVKAGSVWKRPSRAPSAMMAVSVPSTSRR